MIFFSYSLMTWAWSSLSKVKEGLTLGNFPLPCPVILLTRSFKKHTLQHKGFSQGQLCEALYTQSKMESPSFKILQWWSKNKNKKKNKKSRDSAQQRGFCSCRAAQSPSPNLTQDLNQIKAQFLLCSTMGRCHSSKSNFMLPDHGRAGEQLSSHHTQTVNAQCA